VLATLLTACGLAADAPSSSAAATSAMGPTATPVVPAARGAYWQSR